MSTTLALFRQSVLILTLLSFVSAPASMAACPKDAYKKQIKSKFTDDVLKTPMDSAIDASQYKGQMNRHTFVREVLKPLSDKKAVEGFTILPGNTIEGKLEFLDSKVISNLIGKDVDAVLPGISQVADWLVAHGPTYSFLTIEESIEKAMKELGLRIPGVASWDLAMLYPLVMYGGVLVKYADGSFALSVNYAKRKGNNPLEGESDVGVQTGRTYFFGTKKKGNDISDKQHCDEEQILFINKPLQLLAGLKVANRIETNLDNTGFSELDPEVRDFITGYLAVMDAEGIRNNMDGTMNTNAWERILRRKTALGAHYAGLRMAGRDFKDGVPVMYKFGPFGIHKPVYTTRDYNPYGKNPLGKDLRGRDIKNEWGGITTVYTLRKTNFNSWWQRGQTWKSAAEKNFKPGADNLQTRSGLGSTDEASEQVEIEQTLVMKQRNPGLYVRMKEAIGGEGENLSDEFARFMYGNETPRVFAPGKVKELDTLWDEYLDFCAKHAVEVDENLARKAAAGDLPETVTLISDKWGWRINERGQPLDKYGNVMKDAKIDRTNGNIVSTKPGQVGKVIMRSRVSRVSR